MNDNAIFEQDIDPIDGFWMEDISWQSSQSSTNEWTPAGQDGFLGCINNNPIIASIAAFAFGAIAFYLVALVFFS
jgi:hypothetical protein